MDVFPAKHTSGWRWRPNSANEKPIVNFAGNVLVGDERLCGNVSKIAPVSRANKIYYCDKYAQFV